MTASRSGAFLRVRLVRQTPLSSHSCPGWNLGHHPASFQPQRFGHLVYLAPAWRGRYKHDINTVVDLWDF